MQTKLLLQAFITVVIMTPAGPRQCSTEEIAAYIAANRARVTNESAPSFGEIIQRGYARGQRVNGGQAADAENRADRPR